MPAVLCMARRMNTNLNINPKPRSNRMKPKATITAALVASAIALTASPAGALQQVCAPLDSGKIDTPTAGATLPVAAPEGKLIDGYCVKAGSAKQGDGPQNVSVNPVTVLLISHPSFKNISHYSLSYVDIEPTPTTTVPDTTPTTTVPAITGPATVDQPPVRLTTDSCILFDGTRLAEGTYVLGQVDGVTVGATARYIVPCAPVAVVKPPVAVQPPIELPETGSETAVIALLAAALIAVGIGTMRVSRRGA